MWTSCLSHAPRLGTEPATQARALTRNQTAAFTLQDAQPSEPLRQGWLYFSLKKRYTWVCGSPANKKYLQYKFYLLSFQYHLVSEWFIPLVPLPICFSVIYLPSTALSPILRTKEIQQLLKKSSSRNCWKTEPQISVTLTKRQWSRGPFILRQSRNELHVCSLCLIFYWLLYFSFIFVGFFFFFCKLMKLVLSLRYGFTNTGRELNEIGSKTVPSCSAMFSPLLLGNNENRLPTEELCVEETIRCGGGKGPAGFLTRKVSRWGRNTPTGTRAL